MTAAIGAGADAFAARQLGRQRGSPTPHAPQRRAELGPHVPPFALRNLHRVVRDVDLQEPLKWQRTNRLKAGAIRTLPPVRVQLAEIWSVRLMVRVRQSLRRLLREDPWAARFGLDVRAAHEGPPWTFVVEGTHPHDLPDAWWGPEPVPLCTPDGENEMVTVMRALTQ